MVPVVVKFPATVELAWETNPLANVARSVRLSVPAERTPILPFVENKFVDDAVVLKRFIVVAFANVESPVTPRVPATERLPAESKVEVAVPPKYALSKTESWEDEALATENTPPPVRLKTPETVRSPVTVVVARPVAPDAERVVAETAVPDIEPPEMSAPVMVPPDIATSESWSILFVSAMVFTMPPEAGGVETYVMGAGEDDTP